MTNEGERQWEKYKNALLNKWRRKKHFVEQMQEHFVEQMREHFV